MYTKILMAMVFLCSSSAFADWSDMEYEIGGYTASYEGSTFGTQLKIGNEKWPVYVWAGYEGLETRILGQGVSDVDILSVGIGAEHKWGEFSVFINAGYAMMDYSVKQGIVDEIVYTQLVNHHNTGDERPVPAADPTRPYGYGGQDTKYHPDDARTSYEIDDEFIGRIGIGYQVFKHVKLTASYRYLTPKETIKLWDVKQVERGGGWWQESNERDLSAWEIGIYATF